MLKKFLILTAITIFMSAAVFAAPKTGCRKFNFTGTFLSPSLNTDAFGDGQVIHSYAFQLTLHADGTANQYWTGLPDYMINLGSGSPQIGSWTCRDDGKLVLILVQGSYLPVTTTDDPFHLTSPDITLLSHSRTTYLFSVDDDNTVTRIQSRTRTYTPAQDPTDATGGSLGSVSSLVRSYKRLAATDADLLAP